MKPHRSLFFILLVLVFPTWTFSQADEKLQVMLDYPETRAQTIVNARKLIAKKICAGDTTSLSQLVNYLDNQIADGQTWVFYPEETWLLNYWLLQYNKVLESVRGFDTIPSRPGEKIKAPPYDNLFEEMIEATRDRRENFYEHMKGSSVYSDEEKAFMALHLDQILSWGLAKDEKVDSLNAQVEEFMRKFPNSKYGTYVSRHCGLAFKERKFSFSAGFFTGAGFYNGELGQCMSPVIPLGVEFDFRWRHFAIKGIDYIGFAKTTDTIHNGITNWRKNAAARVFIPGIMLGYYFLDTKRYKLCPFAGISSSAIGPPLFQSEKAGNVDVGFDFTATPTFGISFEIFLRPEKETSYNWVNRDLHYFRLSYVYYTPKFAEKYGRYGGNMHSIMLGYVMYNRPRVRIK